MKPKSEGLDRVERDFGLGFGWSLFAHAVLITLVLYRATLPPDKIVRFVPTLRVDLVALPDVLKKDKAIVAPAPPQAEEVTAKPKEKELPSKKAKSEPPEKTDQMVLNPKKAGDKHKTKERENKLKNALNRIKALSKITDEEPEPSRTQIIKGNQISKGKSVSEDAREGGEVSYLDTLRLRLQDYWALPVWLARQNLSAQVQIFIDSKGRMQSFIFTKNSTNPRFDEEVKKTLAAAQPFPKPPAGESYLTRGILVGFPL